MFYWIEVDGFDIRGTNELVTSIIHSLTSSETIRRVRANIQNKLGLFLPTESVAEARGIKKYAVRDWVNETRD